MFGSVWSHNALCSCLCNTFKKSRGIFQVRTSGWFALTIYTNSQTATANNRCNCYKGLCLNGLKVQDTCNAPRSLDSAAQELNQISSNLNQIDTIYLCLSLSLCVCVSAYETTTMVLQFNCQLSCQKLYFSRLWLCLYGHFQYSWEPSTST